MELKFTKKTRQGEAYSGGGNAPHMQWRLCG